MPGKVLLADLHLLAVLRHHAVLSREVIPVEVVAEVAVGKESVREHAAASARIDVGAVLLVDRFKKSPASDESILVRSCELALDRGEVALKAGVGDGSLVVFLAGGIAVHTEEEGSAGCDKH